MLVAHFAYLLKDNTQLSNLDRDTLSVQQVDEGIGDAVVSLEVRFTFISPRLGLKRMCVFAITIGQPPGGAGKRSHYTLTRAPSSCKQSNWKFLAQAWYTYQSAERGISALHCLAGLVCQSQ